MKQLTRKLSLLLVATSAVFAQSNGGIQGKITDDAGQPVAGAYVVATPQGPAVRLTVTALTAANGDYSFDKVVPATYVVCVQNPRTAYLDPCVWDKPTQATVRAGQVSRNNNVQVTKGSLLRVRVNDPGQYISRGEGGVLLGVTGPSAGRFIPMGVASRDASGMTFDVAIPVNRTLRLEIASNRLDLADDGGVPLGATPAPITIAQPAGQPDRTVTLQVIGRR